MTRARKSLLINQTTIHFFTLCLGFVLCLPPTSHAADTIVTAVPRIAAPPAGKALINIHQHYRTGFFMRTPIFDTNGTLLIDLPSGGEFQLVCEPGMRTFLTEVPGGGAVQVMTVDAAADKIYDLVLYKPNASGFLPASQIPPAIKAMEKIDKSEKNQELIPARKAEAMRKVLDDLEEHGKRKVFALERNDAVIHFEAAKQKHLAEVKLDFLGGKKSERVHHVSKEDCRPPASK